MSTEENKASVRRFVEEVVHNHNLALIDELVAEGCVDHRSPPGTPTGPEGVRQVYGAALAAFPDFHVTIEDQIAEGDKVVTRETGGGTHLGEYMGIAPTGKRWTNTGITISRIVNGKAVEVWGEQDTLNFMQQIGAIPAFGQVPA